MTPLETTIQAIKSGDKARGKILLSELLITDPKNVKALLWMSDLVHDEERRPILEQVLEIDADCLC